MYTLHTPPTAAHRCALVTAKECARGCMNKQCSDAHSSGVVGQISSRAVYFSLEAGCGSLVYVVVPVFVAPMQSPKSNSPQTVLLV